MKLPCWLIGHRAKDTSKLAISFSNKTAYREWCLNCSKTRVFIIDKNGRHNKYWQVYE